jgi:acetoin utilization deacetylase AcuC-like enzyme
MVHYFSDPAMLDHTPPGGHPERPERLAAVHAQLERSGLLRALRCHPVRPATDEELLRVHAPELLAEVARRGGQGGDYLDPDTWDGPHSDRAARLAAGAAVDAVAAVLAGPGRTAFCAIRPPGHHARPALAMGFCLYDSVAVAAADAIERHGLDRLLIVDFDVHHGNGTQEIFYDDPRVGFLSIHRYPFYPGTGAADETGTGRGLGTTRNVPIRYGTSRHAYHDAFRAALESMAERMRPQFVLLSAGFDAHAADPIGSLGLEVEDFTVLTEEVLDVARVHADGRVVSLLEGGYNVVALSQSVAAHLQALGAEPPFEHHH